MDYIITKLNSVSPNTNCWKCKVKTVRDRFAFYDKYTCNNCNTNYVNFLACGICLEPVICLGIYLECPYQYSRYECSKNSYHDILETSCLSMYKKCEFPLEQYRDFKTIGGNELDFRDFR